MRNYLSLRRLFFLFFVVVQKAPVGRAPLVGVLLRHSSQVFVGGAGSQIQLKQSARLLPVPGGLVGRSPLIAGPLCLPSAEGLASRMRPLAQQ